MRQADASIVVSATERRLLEQDVAGATVFEIPLSREIRTPVSGFEQRMGIGFVGGFAHKPNVDAVRFLLSDVWPLVQAHLADCELFIAGPDLPLEDVASMPANVHYLGHVPDLEAWLAGLKVTVAPLRYGAGAKGKVASSLTNGVPCVATSVAAEGMNLTPGLNILLADQAADFAKHIVDAYTDPQLWSRLSDESIRFAVRELSTDVGDQRLTALLASLGLPAVRAQLPPVTLGTPPESIS